MAAMKIMFFAAALATLCEPSTATGKPAPQRLSALELALARKYVFASCLIARYGNTPMAEEADAWAAGLVEQGSISGEAYRTLSEIGRTQAPPVLTSSKIALKFDSCLNLYNDPRSDALIKKALQAAK